MSVTLSGMVGFLGAGSVEETHVADDLAQAVDLMRGYVRHLRHTAEDGTVQRITCTHDPAAKSYTWTDQRLELEEEERVPETVLDRATEQVAAELFARRDAPSGIVNTQFAGGDPASSGPARLHRDPMTPAYALLVRWAVPF